MKKVSATLRYLRIAPRKVRSVGDLIRGLSVNEAEAQLLHMGRRPSQPLLKLLRSASANATNSGTKPDGLIVESIRVDQGPMLKRYLPRARGMATPLQKKMSHVTIVLSEGSKSAASRFTIVREKKAKKIDDEKPRTPKTSKVRERDAQKEEPNRGGQSDGLLKRVFTRKSNMGS